MSKPNILITCRNQPDIDGFACSIAYSYYKNNTSTDHKYFAQFGAIGTIESQFVADYLDIDYPLIENNEFGTFILVDASENIGLPDIIRPIDVITPTTK
jgi:inorganic pyrophosphatase/exopolyphosphatase